MNQDEANEAYEDLMATLQEHKLDWVVDQVRAHVRAGKLVDVKNIDESRRRPEEYVLSTSSQESRQPKKGFTTEPYTADERLGIVLNAIEVIAVQTTDIQNSLVEFFNLSEDGEETVRFEPDELDSSVSRFVGRPSFERSVSSEKMKELLSRVSESESAL